MDANRARQQMDQFFSQELPHIVDHEAGLFDELTGDRRGSVVVYGAGSLGRKTALGLREMGRTPLAFADGSRALWGTALDGIPVLPPHDVPIRFGADVPVVTAIWSPGPDRRFATIRRQLNALGCTRTIPFAALFWKYPTTFLPHYRLDLPHRIQQAESKVRRVLDLLEDPESRQEFIDQLRWIASSDFGGLTGRDIRETYLPDEIIGLTPHEVFVDCGAFDGDTLRTFLAHRSNAFDRIVAFEPDPSNYRRLESYVGGLPATIRDRIRISCAAVGARRETLRFSASGSIASRISDTGDLEVPCVPLDEFLDGQPATYIKMDIEGAEPKALLGAQCTIARHCPMLAVCVYHRQEHLWELPLQMRALHEDYRLYLRRYGDEFGDLVCYAVPRHRLASLPATDGPP